jgi:hypothetical protein
MTKQVSLFDTVRVPYKTVRSREIQYAIVDISIEAALPTAKLKDFEPLYRWEGRPDLADAQFYVLNDVIYTGLPIHYLENLWGGPLRFDLPRGARPLVDERATATARLRKLIEGGYAVDDDILVPSSPLYPRLLIGFDGFRLEQFYGGMRAQADYEFSGFATNRMAAKGCRDHFHVQIPFNMLDSRRSSFLVGKTMELYGSNRPEHDINGQWVHFTVTRPDLVPRHSEPHAAAVTACLMAAAAVRRKGVTTELAALEYAAEMVKHADLALLGICQLDVIEEKLDELPEVIRQIGDYSAMSWRTRSFMSMCRHVMRHGEHVEVAPHPDIVEMFAGTEAYAEWEFNQRLKNEASILEI